jgi:chromatin remodeling complex protein RSC6
VFFQCMYVHVVVCGLYVSEKAAKKSAGGLQKPYKCSAQLASFIGESQVSRASLTSKMWAYFKSNELMDPDNKRWVGLGTRFTLTLQAKHQLM